MNRQVVLDTETTGLEPSEGHRIIEIGCVEIIDRRITGNNFHQYVQPDREIDSGAIEVHGITNEFLADKPRFAEIAASLIDYLRDSELIIHNAAFDVGFLNHELGLLPEDFGRIQDCCSVTDSLALARKKHPGQRNSLDALCKRYEVNNSHRDLHGALLDAEILAEVYLTMTGGQKSLQLHDDEHENGLGDTPIRRLPAGRPPLVVVKASAEELKAHEQRLRAISESCGQPVPRWDS